MENYGLKYVKLLPICSFILNCNIHKILKVIDSFFNYFYEYFISCKKILWLWDVFLTFTLIFLSKTVLQIYIIFVDLSCSNSWALILKVTLSNSKQLDILEAKFKNCCNPKIYRGKAHRKCITKYIGLNAVHSFLPLFYSYITYCNQYCYLLPNMYRPGQLNWQSFETALLYIKSIIFWNILL